MWILMVTKFGYAECAKISCAHTVYETTKVCYTERFQNFMSIKVVSAEWAHVDMFHRKWVKLKKSLNRIKILVLMNDYNLWHCQIRADFECLLCKPMLALRCPNCAKILSCVLWIVSKLLEIITQPIRAHQFSKLVEDCL